MNKSINKQPILIIGFSILLFLVFTDSLWAPLERKAYDARFRLIQALDIGRSQSSGDVVVVGIIEKSVTREKPILFLYPDIGRFLTKMQEYGVKVIGIDLIPLHRQSEKLKKAVGEMYEGDADARLTASIAEIGERLDRSLLEPLVKVSNNIPIIQAFHGKLLPYYYGSAAFMKKMHMADIELTDGRSISDGVIRSQRLSTNSGDGFAYSIYRWTSGKAANSATVMINYALTRNIPFYCFHDVMAGQVSRDKLSGRAVILTYINGYEDIHRAPIRIVTSSSCLSGSNPLLEDRLPGGLILAVTADTLLTDTGLSEVSPSLQIAIMTGIIALCLGITMVLRLPYAVSGTLAIMILFFIANLLLFAEGKVINLFPLLVSPLLVLLTVYPYRYVVEERQRKKIYKTFSYYLDREVIDSLVDKDPAALLKGELKEACILFLDIRDSTSLSTRIAPENIMRLLNCYFSTITGIIKRHSGFVNQFLGDGILAFFASGEKPAERAIRSALEIIRETEILNHESAFTPYIGDWWIRIGIGIHYGQVILGNIGSEDKMAFSIMGKNVTIAFRIEELTKDFSRTILLSESAYAQAKDVFQFEDLGEAKVKGIDDPIRVYTVTDSLTEGGHL